MSSISMTNETQVKDVYDFAYDIAQEFEKLISFLDSEETIPLINKVIKVLELLENSVKKIEHLERENSELRAKYLKLSNDKTANEDEKLNLKQAFEELEDSWSKESVSLRSFIAKLKAENKLLRRDLTEKEEITPEIDDAWKTVIEDQENFISKLKSNLKQKDNQLEKNITMIEKLNQKIDDLLELNKSLHLRYQETKNLILTTNLGKSEYETEIDLQKQKVHTLENRIESLKMSLIEKKECDMKRIHNCHHQELCITEDNFKSLVQEQHELKQKVFKLQMELSNVKSQTEEYKEKLLTLTGNQNPASKHGHIQQIFRLFLGIVHFKPQVW